MNFCKFRRLKFTRWTKSTAPKMAKTAVFALLEFTKLISRKISVIQKSWKFHTVSKFLVFPHCLHFISCLFTILPDHCALVLGELPSTAVPTLMTGRVTTIQGPKGSNNNNNNPNTSTTGWPKSKFEICIGYNSENVRFWPYVGKAKMCLGSVSLFSVFSCLFLQFSAVCLQYSKLNWHLPNTFWLYQYRVRNA